MVTTRSRRARSTTTRDRHRKRQPPRACNNCGATRVPLQQDHIINIAAGGLDVVANMQWLCHPCHDAKTKLEQQAGRERAKAARGSLSRRSRDLETHPGRLSP
jgi:5-methylcytosine-specific restriction endonuclease McrA